MKKWINIGFFVLILLAVVVVVGIVLRSVFSTQEDAATGSVSVYDSQGNLLCEAQTATDVYESEYWSYLEIVLQEAAQVYAEQEDCTLQEAAEKIFTTNYRIDTTFDPEVFASAQKLEAGWSGKCDTAVAITDLQGNLLAVCSADQTGTKTNHAAERRAPYSSFKALSVYTPAVEKGVASWSTVYKDSPYKQIKNNDGEMLDWPANASGTYSRQNTTVYDALRTSLNTVAVKCLEDVGVAESVTFLQTQLGIPLKQEQQVIDKYGVEEVIGNVALGYLETGITPVEMAGYYQMFANGGFYTAPQAVSKITAQDGTQVYVRKPEQKQVISAATADIMNKLLQGVVDQGGTGSKARCRDVEVAGKTGTGDEYADNWFVGVTPGYSVAVWHGQSDSNHAAEMFSSVVSDLYAKQPDANRKFITHQNLKQVIYCTVSGKAISKNCTTIDMGYFANKNTPQICDQCGK